MKKHILSDSKKILNTSVSELIFAQKMLCLSLEKWGKKLKVFTQTMKNQRNTLFRFRNFHKQCNEFMLKLERYRTKLQAIHATESLKSCFHEREKMYSEYRVILSQYSSFMTCLNWQSPAVKSVFGERMGIEKSRVTADWNDYKRDRSEETFYCEKIFSKYIFECPRLNPDSVLNIFHTGMGAFTSILFFLICEEIVKKKILVSSHIYVENMMLLKKFFPNKLEVIEYTADKKIFERILHTRPSAVFLEPISNTKDIRLFDVENILRLTTEKYSDEIFFIIDTSCSFNFGHYLENIKLPDTMKVIFHGSLLKAPQLGIERTTAGFIQAFGLKNKAHKILDYRSLSGTNISDVSANLLPTTSLKLIHQRMKIIETNAYSLAKFFLDIDSQKEIFLEIVYPKLSTHKDNELAKKSHFSGFFFNIKFHLQYNSDTFFEIFTKEVLRFAKKENCEIVHGASFGFNHTSIYYSVGWNEPENHYLRISPGTETPFEVEALKKVFAQAYFSFKKILLSKKI